MADEKVINLGKCVFEFNENCEITNIIFDPSYAKVLGYTDEEFETIRTQSYLGIHPDDNDRVLAAYAEATKKHTEDFDCDIEYRMMTKWGYRWFHDYGHYTRRPDGSPIRCDIVIFDINDSKTMNVNLGTIQLSHDVLSKSNIGLWAVEMDPDAHPRLYGDEAMMKLIGVEGKCTPEEAFHALDDNVDRDHYEEVQEALKKMGAGFHAEVQYPWHYPDGRTIIIRCGGIRNPTYTKGIRIEGVHRDITDLAHYDREKELIEQVKASEKVKDFFINTYTLVFIVNIDEDTFTTLKRDNSLIRSQTETVKFTEALDSFINNIVYEKDRNMVSKEVDYKNIRNRLTETLEFKVDYRVQKGELTEWHEMSVRKLDENRVVIGIANRNNEIILEHLQEKMNAEFFALFSVDIDTEHLKIIKNSPWYKVGENEGPANYGDAMKKFAQNIDGEPKEFFLRLSDINYVKRIFEKEDKRSYSYQTNLIDGHPWVTVSEYVTSRHEDGSPSTFVLGFSLLDSLGADKQELQKRLTNALSQAQEANERITHQKILLDYFIESYTSAYSIDLINDSFEILHMEHKFSQVFIMNGNRDDMNNFIDTHIYAEDRPLMMKMCNKDYIIERLKNEKHFSFTVREVFDDIVRTMRCIIVRGSDEFHIAVGFLDITDELLKQQEQQEQLQEALFMAQSANRAKTTFLNNMSHDIRTPMNAIIGYTELAASHIDNKEQVEEYLGKISHSSDHLLSLINDVLDMSRIESGKMTIEEKEENLFEIIETIKDILQADVQNKRLDFSVEFNNVSFEKIICDKLRLKQILLNLLSNSIKYTQEGGNIKMSISETKDDVNNLGHFVFCVKDNGMGMSKDFLKQIYEPFTRVKSTTVSGIQGTGLGMSITKSLVEMMGGDIKIESEPNKGTEVTIDFYFNLSDSKDGGPDKVNKQLKEQVNWTENKQDFTGKKILLVEDNELNREIATIFLEENGFIITPAEDGSIAVEKIKEAHKGDYDLIIMDIQMPIMDGYEATKQIRASKSELADIPIVAMTANAFEEDKKMAFEVGMNDYLAKPINLDNLKNVLSKILIN